MTIPQIAVDDNAAQPIKDDKTVYCSDCHEPVHFVRDAEPARLVRGKSTRWRHVRTGLFECQPLCQDCGAPATQARGSESFDGAVVRFMAWRFLCDACGTAYGPAWERL